MRRLNPKSILILSVEWVRRFLFPIVIGIFANGRGAARGGGIEREEMLVLLLIPAGIGLLALTGGVISYVVVRFGIVNGTLLVRRGGIWRQERTIPLERIQNVRITQGLLERVLGIATLQVETASGSGVEASLKSLSVADAEIIKQELLRVHAPSIAEAEATPAVYKAEMKDIALAGALQNRALIVTIAILGLFGQGIDDVFKTVYNMLERNNVTQNAERNPGIFLLVASAGALLFLLVGWILSIGYALTVYYGFRVVKTDKGLQVSYGLLNTVQTVIPMRRIQSIQTRASWLFRAFGLNQLFVQSIGGHHGGAGSENVATGQTLIAPICRPQVLRTLIELINPALQIDQISFLASDKFMLKRGIVRMLISYVFVFTAMSVPLVSFHEGAFIILILPATALYLGLGLLLSILAYRRQGYAHTPEAFMVCSGTLGQSVTMIPIGNVQAVTLESSWFLRRRNLVDLHVSTPVSEAVVPCIPRETADRIKDELIAQSFGKNRKGM